MGRGESGNYAMKNHICVLGSEVNAGLEKGKTRSRTS